MNAFLNFLTQKVVNGIDLSHVKIIAASNIGNYTFEPDTNILSRFCMFYIINSSFNSYITDKRITNTYKDECTRESVIFEPRSLKPRCQEQLSSITDKYLGMFYEGFTNIKYKYFHSNATVNAIIIPYLDCDEKGEYTMSANNLICFIVLLKKKFPRIKTWKKICSQFENLSEKTIEVLFQNLSKEDI